MKLSEAIPLAYETKWSFVNTFTVQMIIPPALKKDSGWTDADDERIQLNIISISTPQFTNSAIETYIGGKWYLGNGRDELYRVAITFRDHNQMDLYRKFAQMYKSTREQYFDDARIKITISKDGDWNSENTVELIKLDNAIIESVSQIQFSNTTENQIAEFSVGFKSATTTLL